MRRDAKRQRLTASALLRSYAQAPPRLWQLPQSPERSGRRCLPGTTPREQPHLAGSRRSLEGIADRVDIRMSVLQRDGRIRRGFADGTS
jgi:hypothetical protein